MTPRQLRLPRMPRRVPRAQPSAWQHWQACAVLEDAALDRLEADEWAEFCEVKDDECTCPECVYDRAHAATVAAFAPLAPLVRAWWTRPGGCAVRIV